MPAFGTGSPKPPPPPLLTGNRVTGDRNIAFSPDGSRIILLNCTYPIVQQFSIDGGLPSQYPPLTDGVWDADIYPQPIRILPAPGTNFVADAIRTAFWANATIGGGGQIEDPWTNSIKRNRAGLSGVINMNSVYNIHYYQLFTGLGTRAQVVVNKPPFKPFDFLTPIGPAQNVPTKSPTGLTSQQLLELKSIAKAIENQDPAIMQEVRSVLGSKSPTTIFKSLAKRPPGNGIGVSSIVGAAASLLPGKVQQEMAVIPDISVPDAFNPVISTYTTGRTALNPFINSTIGRVPADPAFLISDSAAGLGIGVTSVGNGLEAPIQYMHWFQIVGCTDPTFLPANGLLGNAKNVSGTTSTTRVYQLDNFIPPSFNSDTPVLRAPNGDPYFWSLDNFNNPTNVFYFGGSPTYPWYTPQYFLDTPLDARIPTVRGKTVYYTFILCRGFWYKFNFPDNPPGSFVVLPSGPVVNFESGYSVVLNTNGFIWGFSLTDVLGAGLQVDTSGQGQPFGADFP